MSNENYGILHNHSECSARDSAMSIEAMFKRAKELGATAIALTDHGILTGFYDFMKLGAEYGIKPIPGIEAYFTPNGEDASDTRQHLILMAKDMAGFRAICDANYQSYKYLYKSPAGEFPRMDFQILKDCFGPGSSGYGHVFATSACMQGVLAQILLSNENITIEAAKIAKKRDKYHPIDNELLDGLKAEEEMVQEIEALIARREELSAETKVSTSGISRRLKLLDPSSEEYKSLSAELEDAKKRKETAKAKLDEVKREIANKKRAKTEYSKTIKAMKESSSKWANYNDQMEAVLATAKSDKVLYDMAKKACQKFVAIFGEGNFFIELQYHHISSEAKAMPILVKLAKELNVPTVAANDAHYATNSYEDVRARTIVAAMRFNTPIGDPGEGFGELYMKPEDELRGTLTEILDKDVVEQSLKNIRVITAACNVELERSTHYPVFVGGVPGETASQRLRRLAEEGISKRYPGSMWTAEYQKRMDYELGVIDKMGYSDYLCIVQDFLEYGRSLGYDCPEKVGYTIGPGRGSAVGSIVCYLSGITSVDPMKYGLLFERFLNPERVSMPDIDSDFSPEIREKVIDYVKEKYGPASIRELGLAPGKNGEPICGIITKGTLAGRAAIRGVGRVIDIPASIVDSTARLVPAEPGAKIDDIPNLEELCENAVVKKLIDDAKLVEGTVISYGVHAAGVIIADNGDVSQYVPLQYNSKKDLWVAQCDMGQCESDAGLLKMDFLGLKNLGIITDTLRRVYHNYSKSIDIEQVPMEPEVFANIFSNGNTNCVFQFESGGMKDMLRQFRPFSMEDIILLVAAYRPGPMQYIPEIIQVKQGKKKPHYIADGLEEIFAPTYGSPIYQEQMCEAFAV